MLAEFKNRWPKIIGPEVTPRWHRNSWNNDDNDDKDLYILWFQRQIILSRKCSGSPWSTARFEGLSLGLQAWTAKCLEQRSTEEQLL